MQIHVIIVDDGSTDGTAQAVRENFPDVEILTGSGDLWYTAGTNSGIVAALRHEPDFVLAINNDSIFDEKCVLRMVECAEQYPKSVVGSLLLEWSAPHKVFQVAPRWELLKGGYRHWFRQTVWTVPERPWEVEMIVGNCVLYPAGVIREVGLMDEKRLPQYGDAEYTPRMRRAGWRLIIEPRARTFCKPNDPATGFRQMSPSQKIKRLFSDPFSPYSFRRKFYGNIGGAPNIFQGLLAIPIYYLRLLIGRNTEGNWALQQGEEPLSRTFAHAVLDERN